jgi:hypothetical protein
VVGTWLAYLPVSLVVCGLVLVPATDLGGVAIAAGIAGGTAQAMADATVSPSGVVWRNLVVRRALGWDEIREVVLDRAAWAAGTRPTVVLVDRAGHRHPIQAAFGCGRHRIEFARAVVTAAAAAGVAWTFGRHPAGSPRKGPAGPDQHRRDWPGIA